ncbi:hypothetical protein BU26DRAFT_518373 [Trematosphaeria pertusa]|uniref:Uncharacterized protein n=1 Tax=Trematosphaeria pertusa TaxID=390896 RepID=A0A6A6IJU7_9PLEO|nr:uncharacterized protein BU26DRAFT_518373 [Trematosphaeria pertusa]KAF2249840.1 hypothetical protein BU26DRAFT_518373 [Trematosphaeria pertusa]
MHSPPYIFFHGPKGYWWEDGTDPALKKLPTLNDAPHDLLPSLAINVSQPDALVAWLETNNAALITDLTVHVDATASAPSPQRWCVLFDKLRREATNLQNLSVYWDADGLIHMGLGKSVVFIRGLAQLKVQRSVEIGGFYATQWPRYLEAKMGLKPVDKNIVPGGAWEGLLRDYQRGTEHRNPWIDSKDGTWDTPHSVDLFGCARS